jgi:hypothetical protein
MVIPYAQWFQIKSLIMGIQKASETDKQMGDGNRFRQ